jgi:hypothetical protein
MNIGAGDNRIVTANPSGNLNTNQRNQQVVLRIATLTGRTYPGKLASIYGDAKKIHDIAQISVSQ